MVVHFLLLSLLFVHASFRASHADPSLRMNSELVGKLELTDLCLSTEASYTRHLTQTDMNTPFQDNPFSLEHFPSGSILTPPEIVKRSHGKCP